MGLLWPFSHIFFLSKTLLSFNIVRQFFKKRTLLYSPTSKIRKNLWWKTMRYVLNMMKEQWEASTSLEGHHNLCNASLNTSTSHLWSSDIKNVSKWIRMSKCLVLEWSLVNLLNSMYMMVFSKVGFLAFVICFVLGLVYKYKNTNLAGKY